VSEESRSTTADKIKIMSPVGYHSIDTFQFSLRRYGPYSIFRQKPPNIGHFCLVIATKAPDRLIDLLCGREHGQKKDPMISRRQICARSALIHHVQQEHALLTVVLEFLQILAGWSP
jgi:hypothetical protein